MFFCRTGINLGSVAEAFDDLGRAVGRAVIHEHDLVVGIVDLEQRFEAGFEGLRAVVAEQTTTLTFG